MAGKEWGRAFDQNPWPEMEEDDDGDAIGAPEMPTNLDQIILGSRYKSMFDFKMALVDTCIKNSWLVKKLEAKRFTYVAKCQSRTCPWRIRATLKDGWVTVTVYNEKHTCAEDLVIRRDHPMATTEWIAHRAEGLYDLSSLITPARLKAHINKVYGIEPSYKKLYKAKEILVDRLDGNQEASFQILPAYGQELARALQGKRS